MERKIKKLINAIANSENAEEFSKFFDVEDLDFDSVEEVWEDHFQNTNENFFDFWTVDSFTKLIMSSIKEAIAEVDWEISISDEIDDIIDVIIDEDTFYYMYEIDPVAADILIGGYKLGLISGYDIFSYIDKTVGFRLILITA